MTGWRSEATESGRNAGRAKGYIVLSQSEQLADGLFSAGML